MKRALHLTLAALVAACGSSSSPSPSPSPASSTESERVPSAAARWTPAVPPGDRSILEAPAQAVAAPGASAHVAPPFTARVVRILVAPGDRVSAGDPLLEVVMPEVLDAAATWVGSSRRRALRADRRDELEALREEGLVESSRVFEQEASVAELDAEVARALAVLRAAGVSGGRAGATLSRGTSSLTAPIDGVVSAVSVRLGEVRDPSEGALVELVGSAPARIEARLSRPLPEGATLSFVPLGGAPIALRDQADAIVVDPTDGTRLAWISPQTPEPLPDGLRGTLVVHLDRPGVVQVPAGAVGHDAEGAYVLRHDAGEGERVPVHVVASGGGSAIVEASPEHEPALAPGQRVAAQITGPAAEGGDE